MYQQAAREEYQRALKMGQKQAKELIAAGKDPNPRVLDEILDDIATCVIQEFGPVEIPTDRIVGVKSAGRIPAFTADFLPLLDSESEFAGKWIRLCADHLSDTGIRDPILCYEYLGDFYVQEGNKRLSVLNYFGAPKIPGIVHRVLPPSTDEPRVKAYYEFLEFYKGAQIYDVQFHRPGGYAKLLAFLGKDMGEVWTERERRTFTSRFHYFQEACRAQKGDKLELRPEDALLLWLQVYPFQKLSEFSSEELKKSLAGLWGDVVAQHKPAQVQTEAGQKGKPSILSRIITPAPEHLQVAFIHQLAPNVSNWTMGHHGGSEYLADVFADKVTVRSYFRADTPELTEQLLERAVEEGAQVVFTTSPQMSRATLKAAVKYPKVRFLNCSTDAPYSSVRSYYCRIFEGKFITGAIAGAMADNNRIGYIGDYPIFGVPAAINAFALGAQMTNPRAKIELRWSCLPGSPARELVRKGIHVISNRDVPTLDNMYLAFGDYGTYLMKEDGTSTALGAPCWLWGTFYEKIISSILSGAWTQGKETAQPMNYWWGMSSGVIDVKLAEDLPEGVGLLAKTLQEGLRNGTVDPFHRKIVAQDGTVINDGSRTLTPDELLHMDWLCENVEGFIPEFEQIEPYARNMVRTLGVHRDRIPAEKEGGL